jgi:formylglycine-generating enzyme required for sulfatase activity
MTTLFISHSSKDKSWAYEMRDELRNQGYTALFLDSHPDDGISAGAEWEKELYRFLRQSRGLVVLCTTNWLASPWCVAEVMIARERDKKVFMLVTADITDQRQVMVAQDNSAMLRVPDFLKDTQFISLAGLTRDDGYKRLWRGLKEQLQPQDSFALPEQPYPGLHPFGEKDAAVFFGRDDEIQKGETALTRDARKDNKGFILVLGASGCGKSSLVRAGIVPRLTHTAGNGGSGGQWVIPPPVLPGKGLEGLALSLSNAFKVAGRPVCLASLRQRLALARDIGSEIKPAVRALSEISNELLDASNQPEGHVLLILDQLEEVFSTQEGSDARAALRLLLEASAADEGNSLVVLATMRSDFMDTFQNFPGAANRYNEIPLDPMSRVRFGEAIEKPADRFGLRLEPGLTERLVQDIRYEDALPLLAFTLAKLYERGSANGILTLGEYENLFPEVSVKEPDGRTITYRGVSASIKHEADKILENEGYAQLADDHPCMRDLRRAFYRLARVGDRGRFIGRIARRSQMPKSCEAVLQRFVSRRLLVAGNEDHEPTLSVAHEALFRVWDKLQGWLNESREALMLRVHIEEAAAEWNREHRAESHAWSEAHILETVRVIDRTGVSLDDVADPKTVCAFLGPIAMAELERLPGLAQAEDAAAGSGRYGDAWRLPLSHEARASVGVRLSILGDRRKGIGLQDNGTPDIDWCRIEAGEVTIEIEADLNDPNSDRKRLTRTVDAFWMARYPVTIAQFNRFLDDCVQDGHWRLPGSLPMTELASRPPPKRRARLLNHPMDTVNWWDAQAFCHWLSSCLGYAVRLPTDHEWQLAATGGKSERGYPWGSKWDPEAEPWRANTSEGGLGRTTAVGMYPAGASPAGVHDMAGTISEWCQNAFDNPDNLSPSQDTPCVIRGGSWDTTFDLALSTFRNWDYPLNRYNYNGFRVVCSKL